MSTATTPQLRTPKRPCLYHGCGELVPYGYCATHSRTKDLNTYESQRLSSRERGYDKAWARYALAYLYEHPVCVQCDRSFARRDMVVDHITPMAQGGDKWDRANLQALCKWCHNTKTARERRG